MAATYAITHLGMFAVSGTDIKTTLDATAPVLGGMSGAGLYFVPVANGLQMAIIKVDYVA